MLERLNLADARILLWLNHWLSAQPAMYRVGLLLTDKIADLVTVATLLLLWFWRDKERTPLVAEFKPSSASKPSAAWRANGGVLRWAAQGALGALAPRRIAGAGGVSTARPAHKGFEVSTRIESRAQLLVFGVAGLAAYVTARLIALGVDSDRPFATYLPVTSGVQGAFEGLRSYGSFPSDHAALLGALPVALFFWNRRLAWAWTVLSFVLILTRIAVGFHYPKDMVAGTIIGMAYAYGALSLYRRGGRLYAAANATARGFELSNAPYCYILYALLAGVGLEFVMHFQHVLGFIYRFQGEVQSRF